MVPPGLGVRLLRLLSWAGSAAIGDPATRPEGLGASTRVALVLANAIVVLGLLWANVEHERFGLAKTMFALLPRDAQLLLTWLCVGAAVVPPLLRPPWRRLVQVALGLVAIQVITHWEGLALLGSLALVTVVVSRSSLRTGLKLVVIVATWSLLPVLKWLHVTPIALNPGALNFLWACMLYCSVWVIVHRARGDGRSVSDDLFYLVALPRLVSAFGAPMSQRVLLRSEQSPSVRLLLSGLILGAYGLALGALEGLLLRWRPTEFFAVKRILADYAIHYCWAATNLFGAMALFRLFGFGVPSGFRWPFLAQSFREFFRSWNHYVRDAVYELFLLPLQGLLRRYLKSRRAIRVVSAYVAIFTGSFLLNDLLIPLVTSVSFKAGMYQATRPLHLAFQLSFWSAIIWPAELGARRSPRTGWRAGLAILRFNVVYFGLWLVFR